MPTSIMTSPSTTLPQSDESCPAGGTATNGETRTPRRIQWASDDHVRVDGEPETSPQQSIHELDEMGLDVCSYLLIILFRRS